MVILFDGMLHCRLPIKFNLNIKNPLAQQFRLTAPLRDGNFLDREAEPRRDKRMVDEQRSGTAAYGHHEFAGQRPLS